MPRKENQLTAADWASILKLHADGHPMSQIALRFHVGKTLIWRIVNGRENQKTKRKKIKGRRNRGPL